MLWGLYTLGFDWEANDFFYFIADVAEAEEDDAPDHVRDRRRGRARRAARSTTCPATRARGRCASATAPTTRTQHDVWGALLDSVYLHTKSRDQLPERIWPILKQAGRGGARALARARPRHLGGPRRAEALHLVEGDVLGGAATAARGWPRCARSSSYAARWQAAADEIQADICENGVDERGVFTQHYDTDALDASVLLMPLVALPAADDERDPRDRARDRRRADRGRAGAALPRRRDRRRPARARRARFTICSFWLVSALVEIGELERGARRCARSCSRSPARCGSTPRRSTRAPGRHLGNFPQAFTHLALINAVMHVIRADQGLEIGSLPLGRELTPPRSYES